MYRILIAFCSVVAALATPGLATTLSSPKGPVILSVTGDITLTNAEERAEFDLEMLESIDRTRFETSTIWTEDKIAFEGVSLATLLAYLGATGETIMARAINDYTVDIPFSDAVEGGPIIAYRMNGATMSLRNKGPLWIIYPYDDKAEYRSEVTYSRSIWQLDRIEIGE